MPRARGTAAAAFAGGFLVVIGVAVSHAACSGEESGIPGGAITVTGCVLERTPHGEPWTGGDEHAIVDEQTYAAHEQGYAYSRTELRQTRWEYGSDVAHRETYLFVDRAVHLAPLHRSARVTVTARQYDGRVPGTELRWTYAHAEASTWGPGGNAEVLAIASQSRWDDEQCRQSTGARAEAITVYGSTGDRVLDCPIEAPLLPEVP